MQDFIRIGGEIVSSPLNENFRRLLNQISISNTNLIFPEENAVVDTIMEMKAIKEPDDAQTCYVVSSGELYRYTKAGEKWLKIADFGQTFRQGFLNSGAVVLEDCIKLKDGTTTTLLMPAMLVYFKNKPGDDRYLKGMYLIEAVEFDIGNLVNGANAYSIMVDYTGAYSIVTGLPSTDDPNHVFIGTVLVNKQGELVQDFIYTLPDIAYTADRGNFLMNGGQASGCNLVPESGKKVNRRSGYYYDEGINFPIGKTDNFPADSDNGSNFDLKAFGAETPVSQFYYMIPDKPLEHEVLVTDELIVDKYWDGSELKGVPVGFYTIQQHLVTPNGQNIILYGSRLYNSMIDATSNLNTISSLNINFPYIEATRIALGNVAEGFTTSNADYCNFFTMGHLAQVGTVSPEFADNVFNIYSGASDDNTPSRLRFDLKELQDESFNQTYSLFTRKHKDVEHLFGLDKKYITDTSIEDKTIEQEYYNITYDTAGYVIPTQHSIDKIQERLAEIEIEIWNPTLDEEHRHFQSIRYRLFHAEDRLDSHQLQLENHESRIKVVENNKVNKNTIINKHKLGDTTSPDEEKTIVLYTGDLEEGKGLGTVINQWYTDERVKNHTDVSAATKHVNTISKKTTVAEHEIVNPHNLYTDDIGLLDDTDKNFVTADELRRIQSDRLPDNTIERLNAIDAKNLDSVGIYTIPGNGRKPGTTSTKIGDVKHIKFYESGVDVSIDDDGETLLVECLGQMDADTVMFKSRYASIEAEQPELYGGYVDNAVNTAFADNVHGIETATANQYYGTNAKNEVGIFDLPGYVTTEPKDGYTEIDKVFFTPDDGVVEEKHLHPSLADKINNNYHTIYNNGVHKSDEINTLSFGDNLIVQIEGHTATINATGGGSGTGGVSNFVNLTDVDVTYTGNLGKVLVVNDNENGITVADMPSLKNCMLKSTYVDELDPVMVKKARLAKTAEQADTASDASKVNSKSVDDTKTSNAYLWTAEKIISNTSSQIASEGVNTYSGTTVPSNSLGKDGDLYILLEG